MLSTMFKMKSTNVMHIATMQSTFPATASPALLEPAPILALENPRQPNMTQKIGDQHSTSAIMPSTNAQVA